MLFRISAALAALYMVHGAENVDRDKTAAMKAVANSDAAAVIRLCADAREACTVLATKAAPEALAPLVAAAPVIFPNPAPPSKSAKVASNTAEPAPVVVKVKLKRADPLDRDALRRLASRKG